jgi:hypothetical protein
MLKPEWHGITAVFPLVNVSFHVSGVRFITPYSGFVFIGKLFHGL